MKPTKHMIMDIQGHKMNSLKTTTVKARISTDLKDEAEKVLNQLGMSVSDAIRIMLHQVVIRREFPLDLKLPSVNLDPPIVNTIVSNDKNGTKNMNEEKEMYQVYALTSDKLKTVFLSTHVNFAGKTNAFLKEDMKTWGRSEGLQSALDQLSDADDFYVGLDYHVSNGDEYNEIIKRYKNNYKVLGRPKLIKSNQDL